MTEDREGTGPGLQDLVRIIRRRLGVVLPLLILVPAAALAFSLTQPKEYTASASLLFRDPAFDQKLFGSNFAAPSVDPEREAQTNVTLVSLDVVGSRTARRLGRPRLAGEIQEKINVSEAGKSNVLTVDATDESPRFAARLANAFAAEYVNFRKEADRSKIREAQLLIERRLNQMSPLDRQRARGQALQQRAEQLDVFGSLQTGNAEIVQRASPPSSASSPRPLRNTVLGAVLGLVLALSAAFVLERLDRRFRDPKEIEAIFKRPLLGAIPDSRALAKGGPTAERLPGTDAEAFRLLRANLRYFNVDRDVRTVLVTSAAPEDGKSTVAWNLAAAAAGAGVRTLLIEADLRRPSLGAALGLSRSDGLSTVLAGDRPVADAVQQVPIPTRENGARSRRTIDVLLSGPLPPNPSDLVGSEQMRAILHQAEQRYDFVVIDTPPTSVVSDAIPLVNQVGGVIIVGRLGKTTREAVIHLRDQLENLDAPTLGVVVNAMGQKGDAYGYAYGRRYHNQ